MHVSLGLGKGAPSGGGGGCYFQIIADYSLLLHGCVCFFRTGGAVIDRTKDPGVTEGLAHCGHETRPVDIE